MLAGSGHRSAETSVEARAVEELLASWCLDGGLVWDDDGPELLSEARKGVGRRADFCVSRLLRQAAILERASRTDGDAGLDWGRLRQWHEG